MQQATVYVPLPAQARMLLFSHHVGQPARVMSAAIAVLTRQQRLHHGLSEELSGKPCYQL